MTIIAAPDSFKGNMSADEACAAIKEGILRADANATVHTIPLADGGEGTARVIAHNAGGHFVKAAVTGPLGDTVEAEFALIHGGRVAVLDMASASGITLVGRDKLNPMKATSYGTGELIAAAMDSGAQEIIIGIGGSATNDGGIGMISALGFKVLDGQGQPVGRGGAGLSKIAAVDASGADSSINNISFKVACDVTNPLLGPSGASAVFGPQKGATPQMALLLEEGLSKLAQAWIRAGMASDVEQPGDGAAGGVGAALRICLGAKTESGAMLVMRHAGFFERLHEADLVITGEGRTDSQTAGGKLCSVVAREGRRAGVPVALLSGALGGDIGELLSMFDYAASIACGETSLDAMMANAKRNLAFSAENLIRWHKIYPAAMR
ncbi:MAG: glycerate kinase [Treponema sp.]|jgi:glycerate kinase|nr:glycerate kinase [Treponema sp.]